MSDTSRKSWQVVIYFEMDIKISMCTVRRLNQSQWVSVAKDTPNIHCCFSTKTNFVNLIVHCFFLMSLSRLKCKRIADLPSDLI